MLSTSVSDSSVSSNPGVSTSVIDLPNNRKALLFSTCLVQDANPLPIRSPDGLMSSMNLVSLSLTQLLVHNPLTDVFPVPVGPITLDDRWAVAQLTIISILLTR